MKVHNKNITGRTKIHFSKCSLYWIYFNSVAYGTRVLWYFSASDCTLGSIFCGVLSLEHWRCNLIGTLTAEIWVKVCMQFWRLLKHWQIVQINIRHPTEKPVRQKYRKMFCRYITLAEPAQFFFSHILFRNLNSFARQINKIIIGMVKAFVKMV